MNIDQDLPYGMDNTYLNTMEPSGIFRSWIWSSTESSSGRTDVVHRMTLTMTMTDKQSGIYKEIGLENIEINEGEGMKDQNNIKAFGKEISFAFSKSASAEWKLLAGADEFWYLAVCSYYFSDIFH